MTERARTRVRGRPGGVDVVDQADGSRCGRNGFHRPANVAPPLGEREPPLSRERASSAQEVGDGDTPHAAERHGEPARRNVSALEGTLRISRDEDERVDGGAADDLRDERRSLDREPSASVLLPLPHEPPCSLVVDDRRAGACEGKTAAGALGAAAYRPRTGRSAALANRPVQPCERAAALGAERSSGQRADRAPLREEELEHVLILGG
jgi:hypothetical protein